MKTTLQNFTLIVISLLAFNTASAQKGTYITNGGMSIGFGLGASYQGSDIINSNGTGFDFWLGHQLYKKEKAFLAVDWRFHFLTGSNKAYDHRINTDGTYSNVRLNFYNYDLELGLTLNRLRERTRIVVTGFAGAGITHGRTFADLYDSNNNLYDYSVIDPGMPASQIEAGLKSLSDKDFETKITNKGSILPTAGIFIGYQFTPGFSIGIEHKINFSLNERNSSFGIDIDNKIVDDSRKDKNHYTSLGFKWSMGRRYSGKSKNTVYGSNTPIPNLPVVTSPVTIAKPDTSRKVSTSPTTNSTNRINTTNPPATTVSSRTTTTGNVTRTATTGVAVVDAGTSRPVTQVPPPTTRTGTQVPPARTGTGTTQKKPAPVISFINPPTPVTVENNQYLIRVQTTNVNAWQDVDVLINGSINTNFSFSPEGLVILNIGLIDGQNRIDVSGENESGSKTETTYITYRKPAVAVVATVTPTTTVTPPTTTTVTPPTTTTVTPPTTTTATPPTTTTATPPTTTTVTPPTTTTVTPPTTTTVTPPTTTTVTPPTTTTVTPPTTTTATPPTTTTVTPPITVTPPTTVEPPCGPRINPGNSSWQFCLVTPGGTYNRDNLENKEFQYSGPASSLYILPIAGGGDAIINGSPYKLRPGQYYLFTGNLTVTVSTKNPGSMGQWSVCIRADRAPVSGNGNNRPTSPCELSPGK